MNHRSGELGGEVATVIGATSNIGQSIAELYLSEGTSLAVSGRLDE